MARLSARRSVMPPVESGPASKTLFVIDTREELINALQEAVQIEHGLLLQYLFAALSCKKRTSEGLSAGQLETVRNWERELLRISRDEMAHLGTVCNLLSAVGGKPRFQRPSFPQSRARWFPFDFQLERLSENSLKRFVQFESPPPHTAAIEKLGIAPDNVAYDFVGELYRSIAAGFTQLEETSEGKLFIGRREVQDSGDWSAGLRIFPIDSVPAALAAIDFIIVQGEGTPQGSHQGSGRSHFERFGQMLGGLLKERSGNPDFEPSRDVIQNPLTRVHRDTGPGYNLLTEGTLAHEVAELFNHIYASMLMMLEQFYDPSGESTSQRTAIQDAARRTMSGMIRPVAEILTELPATNDLQGPRAGPSFELYGDISISSTTEIRWTVLSERISIASDEARRLSRNKETLRLGFVAENLVYLGQALTRARQGGHHDGN